MPLKLWQTGLEHGLGRITKESLLEQLTGQQEEPESFEIPGIEEPQLMEQPSFKSRFFS